MKSKQHEVNVTFVMCTWEHLCMRVLCDRERKRQPGLIRLSFKVFQEDVTRVGGNFRLDQHEMTRLDGNF